MADKYNIGEATSSLSYLKVSEVIDLLKEGTHRDNGEAECRPPGLAWEGGRRGLPLVDFHYKERDIIHFARKRKGCMFDDK